MMMMMMMGIRMMPVVICLPQKIIHALVLQSPFPCASPFEEKGSADFFEMRGWLLLCAPCTEVSWCACFRIR